MGSALRVPQPPVVGSEAASALSLEQVMGDGPFLPVVEAEELGAGHEEHAPALESSPGFSFPVGLLQYGKVKVQHEDPVGEIIR